MGRKLGILVVDDSAFMRRVIMDIIGSDPRFKVAGEACNGEEGLAMVRELEPDVVTLDIQMPVMDGLAMLEQMDSASMPPVVVLSSLAKRDADITIRALELGAFDFILKPDRLAAVRSEALKKELTDKLHAAAAYSRKKQAYKALSGAGGLPAGPVSKGCETGRESQVRNLVAIGTSTGGPRTLGCLLPRMPADLDAAVVIVQHMPAGFTRSFAERLDAKCALKVKEAEAGDVLKSGHVYVAPGDRHLMVVEQERGRYVVELGNGPEVSGHKPAVDVMMMSLGELKDVRVIGVIMTGMGSDGVKGAAILKSRRQAHLIAQSEESCVVYGMPRSIVEKGLANEIVGLESMHQAILKRLEVD